MKKTKLKGGSLSGTFLCEPHEGNVFIRKEVSLIENREYGFQRWYSQFKRIQRYELIHPDMFPRIIGCGKDGDYAFFDMEYFSGSQTIFDFLSTNVGEQDVQRVFNALLGAMQKLHQVRIHSFASLAPLYIYEEIEQKIAACKENTRFNELLKAERLIINGKIVTPFTHNFEKYKQLFQRVFTDNIETFSHGNLTLENILYKPETNQILFIDPYEENIIDSNLADYSQILQSCNSRYELLNGLTIYVEREGISYRAPPSPGLEHFNKLFQSFLKATLTADEQIVVKLFEISQYMRMLPFKLEIDEDKMILFYGVGSSLLCDLLIDDK